MSFAIEEKCPKSAAVRDFAKLASQRCNRQGTRGTSISVPTLVIDFTSLCGKFPRLKEDIRAVLDSQRSPRGISTTKSSIAGRKGQDDFLIKAAMCPGTSCHSYQL